jgi:hypothetical protein
LYLISRIPDLLGDKTQHSVVLVVGVDPFEIIHTSMSSLCVVLNNIHSLWICLWMCPYPYPSYHHSCLKRKRFSLLEMFCACRLQTTVCSVWWLNLLLIQMVPTLLMSDIYNMFDTSFILWTGICMCPHHIVFALPAIYQQGNTPQLSAMVQAIDPFKMVPSQINVKYMHGA